jgi:hypothetical protein
MKHSFHLMLILNCEAYAFYQWPNLQTFAYHIRIDTKKSMASIFIHSYSYYNR